MSPVGDWLIRMTTKWKTLQRPPFQKVQRFYQVRRIPGVCLLLPDHDLRGVVNTAAIIGLKIMRKIRIKGVSGFHCLLLKFETMSNAVNYVSEIKNMFPPLPPFQKRRFQNKSNSYAYYIKEVSVKSGSVWDDEIGEVKCSKCLESISEKMDIFIPICDHTIHRRCTKNSITDMVSRGNKCWVCDVDRFEDYRSVCSVCKSHTNLWSCEPCYGIFCKSAAVK